MNDENAAELLDTESCVMSDESIQAQQQLRQHLLSSSSASSSAATALLSTESYSPTPESVEHRRKLLLQSHRSSSSSISPSSKSSSISSAASADAPPTPRPLMSRVRVAVDHIVIESTSNCSRDSVEHVVNANSSGAAAPALSPCRRLEPLVVTQSSVLFGRDASLYRILDSDARDDALLVVFPFPEFVEPSPPHCSVAGVGTQMAALNDKPSQPHTQFYVRLCASNGQSVRARLARVAMGEDNARLYGVEHLDAFVLVGNQRRVLVNFHPTTVALGGSRVQINTGYYRGQYNLAQSGAVVGEKVLLHVSWRGMMLPGSPFSVVVTEPSMPPAVFDDPSQWSVTNEGSSSCWQVDRSMAVVHFWHCATPRDVGGAHRSGDVDFIGVEVRGKRAVALNDANIFALGDESALLILLYEQSARALRQMAPSVVRAECISLHRRTAAAVFVFRHARMRAEKRVLKVVAFRAGMLEVKGHIERFAHSRDDVVALHAVHQEPPESDVVPEFIGLELQFAPYTFADVFRGYLAKIREPALATIGTSSGDSSPNTDANVAAARAALRRHDAYVLHVVRRVLEIVEQLHRRGLVHCDIKESNVAVWLNTAPWTVKLLDLESVREMQASTPELAPAPQFIAQTGRRGSSSSQLSARSSKSGPDSGGATPVSDSISATPSYWPSEVPTFAANAMPAVDLYAIAHVLFNCLVDQTLPTFHVAAAWNRAGVNAKKRSAPPPSDKPAPKAVADALAVAKAEPVWYVSKWRRFLAALGGGYDESGAGRMLGALDRLSRDGLPDWLAMPHILASCIGGFEPADVLYFVATHSRVAAAARRGPSLASMYGFKDELNGSDADTACIDVEPYVDCAVGNAESRSALDPSTADDASVAFVTNAIKSLRDGKLRPSDGDDVESAKALIAGKLQQETMHENNIVALKAVLASEKGQSERQRLRVFCTVGKYSDSQVLLALFKQRGLRPSLGSGKVDWPQFSGSLGVHCTLITCDNQMLWMQRNKLPTSAGMWVCGACETVKVDDASPFAAVRRGVLEEIGVKLDLRHDVRLTGLMMKADDYQGGFVGYVKIHANEAACAERPSECRTFQQIKEEFWPAAKNMSESRQPFGVPNTPEDVIDFMRVQNVVSSARFCAMLALRSLHGDEAVDRAIASQRTAPAGLISRARAAIVAGDSASSSSGGSSSSSLVPLSIEDGSHQAHRTVDQLISLLCAAEIADDERLRVAKELNWLSEKLEKAKSLLIK